jgi:hypothetical protein
MHSHGGQCVSHMRSRCLLDKQQLLLHVYTNYSLYEMNVFAMQVLQLEMNFPLQAKYKK